MGKNQEVSRRKSNPLCEQLQKVSPSLVLLNKNSYEISVFGSAPASDKEIAIAVYRLQTCFPEMSKDFFKILSERISKSGMSGKRLEYSVNTILDTFTYRKLTIANILSLDIRCRVITYEAMCNEAMKNGCSTDIYAPIRITGMNKPLWITREDKYKYNIPDEI